MTATPPSEARLSSALRDAMGLIAEGHTPATLQSLTAADYDPVYAMGLRHYEQGAYKEALHIFALLMMVDYLERRFVFAYGATLQMLRRYEDALKYYVLCAVLDANDPNPALHLAECLIQLGRHDEARTGLNAIIADHKRLDDRAALAARAQALLELMPADPAKLEVQ